ncbi:MAG: methyltransferase domain-containing protein [Rhodobacteraceae bacterium]|nr:methyltransferase domain-containing protein [Paracoccaceae bacterium]
MLQFNAETLKILDASYHGADITRRRARNMEAVSPRPGERILDLGCGQGLLTIELARAVGATGSVIGVDPSSDMRSKARELCSDLQNVEILNGSAGQLPIADSSLDAAISLQVFEYLPDIPGALRDLQAKLRSGGRLVVGDMLWDTFCWESDNPERMSSMMLAWERHVAEKSVPALLPSALETAGFLWLETAPLTFSATVLRPDGFPLMLMYLMRAYAIEQNLLAAEDANDWFEEQVNRSEEGRFFFSLTHFITKAIRP